MGNLKYLQSTLGNPDEQPTPEEMAKERTKMRRIAASIVRKIKAKNAEGSRQMIEAIIMNELQHNPEVKCCLLRMDISDEVWRLLRPDNQKL